MNDLWAVTAELDELAKRIDPFIQIDKNGHPYVVADAPEGTLELYEKALELGKKETDLMIKYGVQY